MCIATLRVSQGTACKLCSITLFNYISSIKYVIGKIRIAHVHVAGNKNKNL